MTEKKKYVPPQEMLRRRDVRENMAGKHAPTGKVPLWEPYDAMAHRTGASHENYPTRVARYRSLMRTVRPMPDRGRVGQWTGPELPRNGGSRGGNGGRGRGRGGGRSNGRYG